MSGIEGDVEAAPMQSVLLLKTAVKHRDWVDWTQDLIQPCNKIHTELQGHRGFQQVFLGS